MQLFKLLNIAIPRAGLPFEEDEEPRPIIHRIRSHDPQTGVTARRGVNFEITEDYVPPPDPEIPKEEVNLFSDFFLEPAPPKPSGPENEVIGGFTLRSGSRYTKGLRAVLITAWCTFWLVAVPALSYTIYTWR